MKYKKMSDTAGHDQLPGLSRPLRTDAARSRDAIFRTAKRLFSKKSYDKVVLEAVAREAGVNISAVGRYFGSKQGLFAEVVKELMDPAKFIRGKRATMGTRLSEHIFLKKYSAESLDAMFLILRSTMSPEALGVIREVNDEYFAKPLALWLGGRDADLRAHLIQSTILGMIQARQVNEGFEPSEDVTRTFCQRIGKWLQGLIDGTWGFGESGDLSQIIEAVNHRRGSRQAADSSWKASSVHSEPLFPEVADVDAAHESTGYAGFPTPTYPEDSKRGLKGARRDSTETRNAILLSAISEFTAASYEAVGLRSIAQGAEVDVALIGRYFGSKQELFTLVVQKLMNPEYIIRGKRSTFGRRVAKAIFGGPVVDYGLMNIFLILRSAMSPAALPVVRRYNTEYFVTPLARWIGGRNCQLRAQFISLAIYGSVQMRLLDRETDKYGPISSTAERYLGEWLQLLIDENSDLIIT